MTLIINPGSRISPEADGWTNTRPQAAIYAFEWAKRMRAEGFQDIEVVDTGIENEGRWLFTFRHEVTEVTVKLEQHGIHPLDAYEKQCVFTPRVYWNGSSCANPQLDDFAADGFVPVKTFKRVVEAPQGEK